MEDETKKIECIDFQGNKYEVNTNQLTFRPSVYGIIIRDGKILLSKQWDGYDIPGGGIDLGETVEDALVREVKEETGLNIKVGRVVTVENSFFKLPNTPHGGKYIHSILIYYLCEFVSGNLSADFLDSHEKHYADKPEWINLKNIDKIKFYNSADSIKIVKMAENLLSL